MYQSLGSLFYDGVRASFEQYIIAASQRSVGDGSLLRPARSAMDILYHFGEHYRLEHDPNFTTIYIEALCPGYKLLGNLVDAGKHHTISRKNRKVTKANQLSEAVRVTTFRDTQGLYMNNEALVVATLDDNTEVDILSVMSRVINFWGKLLFDEKLMAFRYSHNYMGEQVIPRHLIQPPVNMKATVGIYFSVKMIGRYYDYSTQSFKDAPIQVN